MGRTRQNEREPDLNAKLQMNKHIKASGHVWNRVTDVNVRRLLYLSDLQWIAMQNILWLSPVISSARLYMTRLYLYAIKKLNRVVEDFLSCTQNNRKIVHPSLRHACNHGTLCHRFA